MALTLYLAMTRNSVNVWALSLEDVEAMTTTSILSLNVRGIAASQVIIAASQVIESGNNSESGNNNESG